MWEVPRSTHRIYARWLSGSVSSLRENLLSRWVKFFQSLLSGPSPEVAVIARVAASDIRSTTGANNKLILESTGLDAGVATSKQVRYMLHEREREMTEEEQAVVWELGQLLEDREIMKYQGLETMLISERINFLCEN